MQLTQETQRLLQICTTGRKLAEKLGDPPNVVTQALQKHTHKDGARNNNYITVSVGTWRWLAITADPLVTADIHLCA